MPQLPPLELGTIIRGHRIERLIAQSKMSRVYDARHIQLNDRRVIKEMAPDRDDPQTVQDAQRLFLQEGRILSQLRHIHLPKVYDAFTQGGRSFLVMEFVEGQTLEALQKQYGPVPESRVREWLEQLCDILTYLHGRQPPVIFRDLKPSNVMLQLDGTIKLIDFGIARTFTFGQSRDTVLAGTPGYSPREQLEGGQTDIHSDIYALGKLVWALPS
jgi:serine/threonine protein kinase